MTKEQRILNSFGSFTEKGEQIAFIIALELAGENIIANKCKETIGMGAR